MVLALTVVVIGEVVTASIMGHTVVVDVIKWSGTYCGLSLCHGRSHGRTVVPYDVVDGVDCSAVVMSEAAVDEVGFNVVVISVSLSM